ncbi:hypothetical protein Cgig2_013908 [Carnegiea gigantea]|uniref:SWIM-type domain-containing protein n=1 Tax=Carnegiea gigantea TaxID=171969 RepID=A0A9Q1Q8S8_9CARY|nr:hypothetical protein Cgig2_013908 [Carnegiea gigantea]
MGWVFDLGCEDGEVQVATLTIDWEGDRRCWWRGYERAMDVNAAVAGEGGRGREIVMEMLVVVEVDSDVKVIFKGNDEHGYIYVAGNAGPVRRQHARAAVCEARVWMVCSNYRSLGLEGGEQPASRLHLGGDTIEMSDDHEISVTSEDASGEEVTEEDDVGDEGVAAEQCGDGNKRKGCADGNDVNDNVWPRSHMHAQSHHRKLSIWKKLIGGRGRYFNLWKHLEKLGKKMDQHKTEMLKWKNGVGERIKQKLADTYKKMGCIAAVECYSLMQWQMRGLPCYHALAIIEKANLWVYDYVHPIYKTIMQEGDELDEDYNRCILPPNNGRHLGRPPSKRRELQSQDKKVRRCSKYGKVSHTRRTCCNPLVDFDASYKDDIVEVEDLFVDSYAAWVGQT